MIVIIIIFGAIALPMATSRVSHRDRIPEPPETPEQENSTAEENYITGDSDTEYPEPEETEGVMESPLPFLLIISLLGVIVMASERDRFF